VTAYNDIADLNTCLEMGANYHCPKPVNLKKLFLIFENFITTKKKEEFIEKSKQKK